MTEDASDTMRDEYDFSKGVRGKHYEAYRRGTNVVLLEPNVAEVFKGLGLRQSGPPDDSAAGRGSRREHGRRVAKEMETQ